MEVHHKLRSRSAGCQYRNDAGNRLLILLDLMTEPAHQVGLPLTPKTCHAPRATALNSCLRLTNHGADTIL